MTLSTLIFLTICGYAFSITIDDCPSKVARDDHLQVYANSCFQFLTSLKRDFVGAEDYCKGNNGHLVTIESEEVNNWISKQLRDVYSNDENVWIGFNDRFTENDHEWMDGSDVTYNNWAPQNGPLSSHQPVQWAIDCATLNSDNKYWYDEQCGNGLFNMWGLAGNYKKPFVCRYRVDVPEETSPDEDSQDKEESPSESEGENDPSEAGDENVDSSETETENVKEQSETETPEAAAQKENDDMIRADLDNFFNECGEISCDKACGMSGLKKDDKGCFLCECED